MALTAQTYARLETLSIPILSLENLKYPWQGLRRIVN